MDDLDHYIEQASSEQLRELFLKLNDKMDEKSYEKLDPLYHEIKDFFSTGDCFVRKQVYDNSEVLLFIKGVEVTRTRQVVTVSFKEGYQVSYSDGSRNNVMLSQARYVGSLLACCKVSQFQVTL